MKNSIIDEIEKICDAHDTNANECLAKIKEVITCERKPDFSKIKDGEHFIYKGIEFIRLGKEQGGILCITAKVWKELPFDKDGCNNFKKASICKALNNEFRPLLDDNDLLTYQMDLTVDNGDKAYGSLCVHVGLLSADLYRKYRDYIPLFDEWMWTCTAWDSISSGYSGSVRGVYYLGTLGSDSANHVHGVVPACIFVENQ